MDRKTAAIRGMRTVKFLLPAHPISVTATQRSTPTYCSAHMLCCYQQDRHTDGHQTVSWTKTLHRKKPAASIKKVVKVIAERMVPDLIPVLSSQPVGGVSHKPGVRLPLQTVSVCMT